MGTLIQDIKSQSNWAVNAFNDDGYQLDYSFQSIMEVDKFFFINSKNGKPKDGSRLPMKGFGPILFSIGSYIGETVIKNIPGSEWLLNSEDPDDEQNVSLRLPDGTIFWPIQRVFKRFNFGNNESIYPYILAVTKDFHSEKFDESFWDLENKFGNMDPSTLNFFDLENKIFQVRAGHYKSITFRESEIWLSLYSISRFKQFEKTIQKTGMMKSTLVIPITALTEVKFNEASKAIKIKYSNKKEKKQSIEFDDKVLANQLGTYLGEKLDLQKTTKTEQQIMPLLWNFFFVLMAILTTYIFVTLEDSTELIAGSSARNKSKGFVFKLIIDTIGQTGAFILGTLFTLYFIYRLYDRYMNPGLETTYRKL